MSTYWGTGRGLYRNGNLIGMMTTPDDAADVADAMNARDRVLAARGTFAGPPGKEQLYRVDPLHQVTCERTGPHRCPLSEGDPVNHTPDGMPEPPVGSYP